MRIVIEVEDWAYNVMQDLFSRQGISLELFLKNYINQVAAMTVTNPNILAEIAEKSLQVDGYSELEQRVLDKSKIPLEEGQP